jgi:hypothetical protein
MDRRRRNRKREGAEGIGDRRGADGIRRAAARARGALAVRVAKQR